MPRTIKDIAIVATSLILSGCAFPDKDGDFGAYVHNCQQYAYGKAYAFEHRDLAYKICKDAAKLWGDEVPAYVIRQIKLHPEIPEDEIKYAAMAGSLGNN
ncbi:TPA: hypothetical protein MBF86_003624 [Klebsiella pneumoniae]|uniref:hypothetical protein n=1 Tax=Klebsiella pneumoniae TaxID=573 RepID=UPI0007CCFDC0|nr:hypothetical protein [Klebsiella pneumoniae]TYY39768.1 hypothetical protein FCG92_019355 [Klebsiella pneumoniae]SAQ18728.1 lipoprotein [Klebsiella pneumoniae]HBX6276066.1 hypothetical protein [Klebsiella pneumoniae]HBY6651820.1 hypothetical protein [Klebsiella pneumoniae]HBZ4330682.1 hypothetical protein [Klebsiella pneumoniae]